MGGKQVKPTLWQRFFGSRYDEYVYRKGKLMHVSKFLRYRGQEWELDSYDVETYKRNVEAASGGW
jgi:hypothetical protein